MRLGVNKILLFNTYRSELFPENNSTNFFNFIEITRIFVKFGLAVDGSRQLSFDESL